MTTRARHRATSDDLFTWSTQWPRDGRASACAAVTGRNLPGFEVSGQPGFGSGNVSLTVGDDRTVVEQRRAAIAQQAGADALVIAHQVHGREVAVVTAETIALAPGTITADALVTAEANVMLGVTVADCVPVMLVDPSAGVVGVAHAGRAGMALGVVPAALDAMADLGATAVHAVVGPSICARCYEVSSDLRDEVASVAPVSASVSRTGTPALDVAAGVLDQLAGRVVQIELLPGCTAESSELFSHRASGGAAGRFAGYVWRPEPVASS